MATKGKSEKKQHIQVFTRVRPLSAQELRSQVVVECVSSKEVSVRDKTQTKTFTFDKVFGPDSRQVDVYKAVVSPLISEVLQGYNCTVFAYGQTGTGKTFTMVGEKSDCHNGSWEDDPSCGVIPRTLNHLFDELKVRADEFTVRVSFLELYNEELCDLLAPNDNDDGKNLKLFEDSMKKGSVIVSGLEERTVHNKDDVYAILEAGNLRRQTAPTLMNAQSSRSHTIFTITVHIKVTTPEGEDLIKTGKLNLVDLAGSENIGRSGAVEMRAREAGSINQSLLTLGRVITSLVERTPHIPYRESKLTRILQDSLGGRTKTSIIATVSPALCNIEETLSTFDYAHRARNITNKPEINQKTSKRVLLKEYTEEIERLRRDLIATREKHGVYLASENYNAIMAERENLNKELVSKLQLLKVREDELAKQEEILKSLNMNLYATQSELAATCEKLQKATKSCIEKEDMLQKLGIQSNALLKTADEAVNDAKTLHDRLAKSRRILEHNVNSTEKFKSNFCWHLNSMKNQTKEFLSKGLSEVDSQMEADKKFVCALIQSQLLLRELTNKVVKETSEQINAIAETVNDQENFNQGFLNDQLEALKSAVSIQNEKAHGIINSLTEYSYKLKSDWEKMFANFEISRKIMEKQKSDLMLVQQHLTELTKISVALPLIFNEKLKKREEALKCYAEKCEFLEKKQLNVKKQIEDFGHSLYKMARDHVELLQRESECEEALKNVHNDKKCEDDNLFSEILEILQNNTGSINTHAEEAGKLNEKIEESAIELIENSAEIILPLLNGVLKVDEKWFNLVKGLIQENSSDLEQKFGKLKENYIDQNKKMKKYSENVENRANEILKIIKIYNSKIESEGNLNKSVVEDAMRDSLNKKQLLSSKISEHSEELFSNIHDRMKEIEIFFSEDIKKDEKTGDTPQRKEFNYPRRLVGFSLNREIPKIEDEENQEDISGSLPDFHALSDDDNIFTKC